jgi:large subunit ribosomal protein L29
MKAKDLQDLRGLSAVEMDKKVMELKGELFNLRFQLATGQLDNPLRIREVKKSIAQLKTVMRENELKSGQN